jgi:hypothetical protein
MTEPAERDARMEADAESIRDAELARRMAEIKSGKPVGQSADRVLAELRQSILGTTTDLIQVPKPVSTRNLLPWMGNVEGWLALLIAGWSWLSAFQAVYPKVDEQDLQVNRLWFWCVLLAVGAGLAVGGIRFGGRTARLVAFWALGLLIPLVLMMEWLLTREYLIYPPRP